MRERTVIRQHKQAFGIEIEPADRKQVHKRPGRSKQIHNRPVRRIVSRSNDPCRFVQHEVHGCPRTERFSFYGEYVPFGIYPERRVRANNAVNFDCAGVKQPLYIATRTESVVCEKFIDTHTVISFLREE
jgi:hypothetical protein